MIQPRPTTSEKPIMLIAGVIRNKVHDHLQSSLFGLSCQFFEVIHGSKYRIDVSKLRGLKSTVNICPFDTIYYR